MTEPPSSFALPDHLSAKNDPRSLSADDRHFARIRATVSRAVAELDERRDRLRREHSHGHAVLERDLELHHLAARTRLLHRYRADLCPGHVVPADGTDPIYIGRIGLLAPDGTQLLVDWRSAVAAPFFSATPTDPRGIVRRRRYRWSGGLIRDYWDEVLVDDGSFSTAALDERSAFVASLGAARTSRMRDVLGSVQADQDVIVRAPAQGVRVVDGGPGTGKSVVALHRAAYLMYSEPEVTRGGGVLVIGPHEHYLSYVADVLPDLGEEGVRLCLLRDLVPGGLAAEPDENPCAAALAGAVDMAVRAIEAAVAFYESPPTEPMTVHTDHGTVTFTGADWAEAFRGPEEGTPHNEARDDVWAVLDTIAADRLGVQPDDVVAALRADDALRTALENGWTIVSAETLVSDLWSVPAFLAHCAPWLDAAERHILRRSASDPVTVSDLPLLDAARRRLGDPAAGLRRERARHVRAAQQAQRRAVREALIAADDSELRVMSMLRGDDLEAALADDDGTDAPTDPLAGPFAHIVVDEAQELTDAEWQMVVARCPSGSLTVVGDRLQARAGFVESWEERLHRVGLRRVEVSTLTVNYRTPAEVMEHAEHAVTAEFPNAVLPTSLRHSGIPVRHGRIDDLGRIVREWLERHDAGTVVIVGAPRPDGVDDRVRSLSAEDAKGLEFDLVILVDLPVGRDPRSPLERAVDRYVAMTRATAALVILEA